MTTWLFYTCIVGLIPIIARIIVWLVSNSAIEPLAIGDLIAFGIVLHSSNINEVNRERSADRTWVAAQNVSSIMFLVIYALLLFAAIASENINSQNLLYITLAMGVATFCLSYSVMKRSSLASDSRGVV